MDSTIISYINRPEPHTIKSILKKKRIPIAAVAEFLGFSYGYTCHILNGDMRITSAVEEKLKILSEHLED